MTVQTLSYTTISCCNIITNTIQSLIETTILTRIINCKKKQILFHYHMENTPFWHL